MVVFLQQESPVLDSKHIFNHISAGTTGCESTGNRLGCGRALGITEPWDMLQLHADLQPLWKGITRHYQRIGLQHTDDVLWTVNLKELGGHIGYQPSVFCYGPDQHQFWGDSEWLDIAEYMQSRNHFMSLAQQLGVDVPKTLCFNSVKEVDIDDLKALRFPCYLKAAVCAPGTGLYPCHDRTELMVSLGNFTDDTAIQIQEEIQTDMFLNLQYKVVGHQAIRLAASEIILDGHSFQGYTMPACYEPWQIVDPIADWLVSRGMKGVFAFDLAVSQTSRGLRFPVIGFRPQYNDASYPALIAQKLHIPEWTALNFTTRHRSLDSLQLQDIEYDHQTGEGAILVNWGTILDGKLMIMLAGSQPYQEALYLELLARL